MEPTHLLLNISHTADAIWRSFDLRQEWRCRRASDLHCLANVINVAGVFTVQNQQRRAKTTVVRVDAFAR
jgi:hypothetical protein